MVVRREHSLIRHLPGNGRPSFRKGNIMKEDKRNSTKSNDRDQNSGGREIRREASGNRDNEVPKRNRDHRTDRDESTQERQGEPKPQRNPMKKDYVPDESDSAKEPSDDQSGSQAPVPGHGAESPLMSLGQHGGAYDDKNLDDPDEF